MHQLAQALPGLPLRHAEAGGDADGPGQRLGGEQAAKFFRDQAGLVEVGVRHEDDELLAAPAAQAVGVAQVALDPMRHVTEHAVADIVTV
ncbi:hypothetical protein D3C72_1908610 [compost metagenome]